MRRSAASALTRTSGPDRRAIRETGALAPLLRQPEYVKPGRAGTITLLLAPTSTALAFENTYKFSALLEAGCNFLQKIFSRPKQWRHHGQRGTPHIGLVCCLLQGSEEGAALARSSIRFRAIDGHPRTERRADAFGDALRRRRGDGRLRVESHAQESRFDRRVQHADRTCPDHHRHRRPLRTRAQGRRDDRNGTDNAVLR